MAVILNVEADHLDFFKDLQDIERSFHKFADLVPSRGSVIVNADNPGAMESVAGLKHPIFTFGLENPADCTAANLTEEDGHPVFDIMIHGKLYAHVKLHVYGRHNVLDALAAASAAYALDLPGKAVEEGLASFAGAGRRFEHKGTFHGAEVYDDYAHHPDEIHALLTTARDLGYKRLVVAFQPHTYSRTAAFFDRFVEELKLADVAILAEILRRPGAEYPGHLLRRPLPQHPRRRILLHTGQGDGGSAQGRPARRPGAHRGRRRHLPCRRKAAGGGVSRVSLSSVP